jgi:SOS response regulatory protein OraA/RecX
VAEQAVQDVVQAEGVDVPAAARKLAERRAEQLQSLPAARRRRRILVYLARRGFSGHEVREMVSQVLA